MAKKDTSPLAMGRMQRGSIANKKKKKDEEEKKAVVQKRPQSSSVSKPTQQQRQNQKSYGTTQPRVTQKQPTPRARTATQQRSVDPKEARRQESARNMRTAATSFASEDRRTAAQAQKMNMPTAEEQRRSRENMRAAGKAIGNTVRESLTDESKARMQRQKSGIQTEEDKLYNEQRNQKRIEVAKNTGRAAKKGVEDTLTGYGKTLADVDEMAKSSDKWTEAKSMKLGIDKDDTAGRAKVEEERQKSIKEARRLRLALGEKQEKRQKEFDEATKNAKGLEKAWYGAVESGTGMATDMAVGALTGTGQVGALASMGIRSYGATRGQAEKEGATENEDRLYSLLQAGKEVGTEMMFQGAGLAKSAFSGGKVGLSLADRAANRLTRNMTGRAADATAAGIRLLGGTAEENAEEFAGWLADPAIKELTYGRNLRQREAKAALKQESDAIRANITSEEDARSAAAYLNSDRFIEEYTQQYKDAGLKDAQAREAAEQMREYLTASLSGDIDRMAELEDSIAATMSGRSLKGWLGEFDKGELADTFASTSLLTLTTGLPAGISTAAKGSAIRDSLGSEGVRALSETAINFEDGVASLKAQAARDRIDEGKELTSTQVYDLAQAQAQQVEKDFKRSEAASGVAETRIKNENYVTPELSFGRDGSVAGDEIIAANYVKESNAATDIIEDLMEQEGAESLTDTEVQNGSRAIAGFKTGAFTVADANALNYTNTTVRTAFSEATGVDLNQYVVKDKQGNIDIPKTNAATKDALFAMAADNYVKTAEAETANWMDNAKGEVVTEVTSRMGAQGSVALQAALDDVDERDRSTYMMNANAADMMYQTARNMGTEWNTVKAEATRMFPKISEQKLEDMYNAGLKDRADASTAALGKQVKIGDAMDLSGEAEAPKGNVFIDTEYAPKGSVVRVFSEIATNLGVDIHLVDDLRTGTGTQANGQYINGAIYININSDFEKNVGYIFMHEVTHHLKLYAPEQFNALENLVRERWFSANPEEMQNEISKRIDLYRRNGQNLSEEEALEEIIADAAHEFINDSNFARQAAETDPSLAKAVLNSIRNALRAIRRILALSNLDDETHMNALFSQLGILDEAERLWLDAYTQAVKNRAAVGLVQWDEDARNSLSTNADQEFTSADTSINSAKVPAVFNKVDWKPGTINIDIGGGRFDTAAEFLEPKGVENLVYDPYNRSEEHNKMVSDRMDEHKADTATISNVLNVIQEKDARLEVLNNAKENVKTDGEIYITVYEGNGSGIGSETSKGYQLNMKLRDYLSEVQEVFPNAYIRKGMIVAPNDTARFSITPEQDADYMAAVESGDMETAQRMVDEAAARSMPRTKLTGRWYHGTENEFTEFNFSQGGKNGTADGFGIYLTNDPEVASSYGNRMIEGYVNVERPASALTTATLTKPELHRLIRRTVDIEAETLQYDGYDSLEDAKKDTWISNYVDTYSAKNLEDAIADVTDSILQFNGNDMDIVQEIMTGMGIRDYGEASAFYDILTEETGIDGFETKWGDESEMADPNTPTIALAFRSEQIKDAAPVTYDDEGNVIPLSERFNMENKDIRYSLPADTVEKIEADIGPMVRFSVPTFKVAQPKAVYKSGVGFTDYYKDISGRELTYELTKKNFSKKQADAVVSYMDKMAAWFEQTGEGSLSSRFRFIGWNDLTNASVQVKRNDANEIIGVTVSAMVKNGEYPVNFDLTTVCNKREGISNVIKNLMDTSVEGESVLNSIKLTDANMWKINQALKAEGIDTACLGCFVEARRYYAQNFMDKIEDKWNTAVRKARKELGLPENEYFDFAHGRQVTGEEWSSIDSLWTAYDESTESKSSPADRIKILMDEIVRNKDVDSPYLKQIRIADILTPEGINGFKQLSNKGHDMVKTIKSIYGTSAPKEILAFTPYNSEIALLPDQMKGMDTPDYLKSIGGIRVQSFSDFKIEHTFEHFQMVADEAARGFYTHGYSKVIAFPRIFGLTGRKINMSVMFDVLPNRAWAQALGISVRKAAKYAKMYQGLQFVKELPEENKDNRPYKEIEIEGVHGYLTYLVSDADYVNSVYDREYAANIEAGMSEDEARRAANVAKPYEQSINYREAVELENQEGYKENVGIIAVAYGDEHLKMLLSDPNVRYIIPYHKSGLPTFISKKTALAIARDYTNFQNTNIAQSWKDANGKDVDFKAEYAEFKKNSKADYPAIEFFKKINDNKYKVKFGSKDSSQKAAMAGTADFDVYEPLETASDIREISNAYLEHCIEKGWCPIFHEFAGDPNYYKMLFDFAVTDGGFKNIYPQRKVKNRYPGLDIDAKAAAGEEITDADLAKLKEEIEKGAATQNNKNMTMANNMGNVMNDILTRGSDNSIIDDTNLQSIRWGTPDYTDVKLGNEEATPEESGEDVRLSISENYDEAYMDAYFDGDDDAMQELVDEAAERAGYGTRLYHGTRSFGFTQIRTSELESKSDGGYYDWSPFFASDSLEVAQTYSSTDEIKRISEAEEPFDEDRFDDEYNDAVGSLVNAINEFAGIYNYMDYSVNPFIAAYKELQTTSHPVKDITEDLIDNVSDIISELSWSRAVDYVEAHPEENISEDEYADELQESIETNSIWVNIDIVNDMLRSYDEGMYGNASSGNYELLANTDNMMQVDAKGHRWNDIPFDAIPERRGYYRTRQLAEIARDEGYDGIQIANLFDDGGHGKGKRQQNPATIYIFFKPESQVKSADPVTYAEDGSVIPLSQRFDPTNNDIRYSLPTQDADGNILTDGQMEYFKNSQARDEQGRLIPVYHGTFRGPRITVFNETPDGIWFTSDRSIAEDYSMGYEMGIPGALYGDERNPYDSDDEYFAKKGIRIEQDSNGEWVAAINRNGREHYWGAAETKEELIDSLYEANENEDLFDSQFTLRDVYPVYLNLENPKIIECNGSMHDDINGTGMTTRELAAEAMAEGYDGIIFRDVVDPFESIDVYVAFSSNQIKDTRNENPTENSDIRYSIPSEDEVMNFAQTESNTTDDLWYTDPVLQEGVIRYSVSKDDFINGVINKWNPAWKTEGHVLKDSSVEPAIRNVIMGAMRDSDTNVKYRQKVVKDTMLVARQAYDKMKSDNYTEAAELLYDHAHSIIENLEFFGNQDQSEFERYKNLRDYLRKTKFTVPEDKRSDIDYEAYRRRNFRKILLGSDGVAPDKEWQNLHEIWPEVFTEDIKGDIPSIMLQLENAVEVYQPYAEAYSSEQCEEFAGDIADSLYDIIYEGEAYKSLADKYDDKAKSMRERHREAMQKVKDNYKEKLNEKTLEAKRREYRKLDAQKAKLTDKYEQKLSDTKDMYERKLKTQQRKADFEIATLKQNREYNIKRLQAEKTRAVEEERRRSAYKVADNRREQRERTIHRQLYNRVLKEYKDLTHRLLNPTKEKAKNIPEQLRQPLAQMLHCFDLEKERSKKLEEMYMIPTRSQLNFRELKDALDKVTKEDPTAYEISDIHEYLKGKMTELADRVDGKTIDSLDIADLQTIKELLVGLNSAIKNGQQLEIDGENYQKQVQCDKLGEGAAEYQKLHGKAKTFSGPREWWDNIANMGELTPVYFFRQIKGLYDMYRQIRRGFDSYVRNEKMVIDKIADILAPYYKTNRKGQKVQGSEIEDWRHSESAETFDLIVGNQTITLTIAQKMSLYCLAKRDQAQKHMFAERGGVVASEITAGSKIHKAEELLKGKIVEQRRVVLTPADIQNIIATLTDEQKEIADNLQKLMTDDMAKLGNETSVKLTGIEMYKEKEYFPIKVQGDSRATNPDNIGIQEKIRNPGFSNPLQGQVSNPIIVDDIFTVVASHCNEMNQYAAYAVPITNFMKVYNGETLDENGEAVKIKTVIRETYGDKAITYIENFINDINGNSFRRHGGLDDVLDKALGQAKKAAVFANLRVALQQPTAIIRAFAVMKVKYFKGVKPSAKETQEMFDHCPIAQWKSWGYYDTHFGRDIEDVMMGKNIPSKMDYFMSEAYGWFDNMTWGMIWQAVKNEVKESNPNVEYGSEEFWELCNERASFVFDSTQVVDSPFHRSDSMRSKNGLVKQMTSFQAEPTLSFNVLRQAFVDAFEESKKGNNTKAKQILGRMLAVWLGQAAFVALAQSMVDALRRKGHKDDDDDEDDAMRWYEVLMKYFTRNYVNNFKDDINPINNIYFIKDIVPGLLNAIKGEYVYGQQNLTFQWLDTLTNGIQMCKKKWEKGEAYSKTWYECLTELFGGLGYAAGLPVKTVMRGAGNAVYWLNKTLGVSVFADDGTVDGAVDRIIAGFRNEGPTSSSTTGESRWFDYENNPISIADGSIVDNALNKIGVNLTANERKAAANERLWDSRTKKAEEIGNKYADLSGEERDKKVWSAVTTYFKGETEDSKAFADMVTSGDYASINAMRRVYLAAGGEAEYFDERVLAESKKALKKTLKYGQTAEEIDAQANIQSYLTSHGMTDGEVSDIIYKSDVAKDMKVAFRLGDKDLMLESLEPLVNAGLTYNDLVRLWDNRNRMDLTKYKGRYKDKLKSTGKFIWPTEGVITSHFGYRNAPTAGASSNHPAIDIGAPQGTAVVAADGGTVIYAGRNSGYGNSVGIKHDNGMVTYYNHLYSWNVKVGDTVGQGQQIAQVGSTGISTGPHLDFKILDTNGKPVDPEQYLQKRQ